MTLLTNCINMTRHSHLYSCKESTHLNKDARNSSQTILTSINFLGQRSQKDSINTSTQVNVRENKVNIMISDLLSYLKRYHE